MDAASAGVVDPDQRWVQQGSNCRGWAVDGLEKGRSPRQEAKSPRLVRQHRPKGAARELDRDGADEENEGTSRRRRPRAYDPREASTTSPRTSAMPIAQARRPSHRTGASSPARADESPDSPSAIARLGSMIGKVGDTIVIESERADATGRRGVIEDVLQEQPATGCAGRTAT